jgi:hypothetical protein
MTFPHLSCKILRDPVTGMIDLGDVQKLKLVLATMSKEEAEKHLTRCYKSGILTAKLYVNSQQEKHMDPGQSDAAVNDRF